MDCVTENRKHNRLPLKLAAVCNKVGVSDEETSFPGETINISTGGLLMGIDSENLMVGDTLSLRMTLPPSSGLMEMGGRISAHAKIVRINGQFQGDFATTAKSVALQFCGVPSFSS